MGEVSSDTAQAIGERLADALVEQCADLGGSPEFFQDALSKALDIITDRVEVEVLASEERSGR